jgi:hypothetical protein
MSEPNRVFDHAGRDMLNPDYWTKNQFLLPGYENTRVRPGVIGFCLILVLAGLILVGVLGVKVLTAAFTPTPVISQSCQLHGIGCPPGVR